MTIDLLFAFAAMTDIILDYLTVVIDGRVGGGAMMMMMMMMVVVVVVA